MPSLEDQLAIVDHIGKETESLQLGGTIVQREIYLLHEYRTRLISDVVTGNLDVRVAATQLPKEVEDVELFDEADALTDVEKDAGDDLDAVYEEAEA